MNIAISTGTFYQVPFVQTLEVIRRAGVSHIELLAHWQGNNGWEMAQHLKGIPPKDVLKMIRESGLKISSLHDGGGVIEAGKASLIAESTLEYLAHGGDDIPCLVFHLAHKKTEDHAWRDSYRATAGQDLRAIKGKLVCVENLPTLPGFVALSSEPADLLAFAEENDIYINLDTTHYAQMDRDIVEATETLKSRVRTVHLSDYLAPHRHLYVGEGVLDLRGCLNRLDLPALHAITLECDIAYDANLTKTVDRIKRAVDYVEEIVGT